MKTKMIFLSVLFCAGLLSAKTPDDMGSTFIKEMIGQLDFVEGRLLQLEDAVPQEKFTWRPAEGVRSISEVYRHAALSNYLFIKFAGYDVPTGVDLNFETWDGVTTDKKQIAEDMKESFKAIKAQLKEMEVADLDKMIKVFGMEMSVRNFLVTMIAHLHEHLGQSIAYARSVGVTPPWSQSEG